MASEIERLHSEVLHTQVRVRTDKAGGSGTVIYSAKQGNGGDYESYVLTCHHVVEDAISVKDEWDSRVGRQRKKEYRQLVGVEFFDYSNVPHGRRPVTYSVPADISAYDSTHDMALLRLRTLKASPGVANLPAVGSWKALTIGSPVIVVGCALGHDPIQTRGEVTHMGDEIDYKDYWMASAAIIFGNSGGAVFADLEGLYRFIGIPSRVAIAGWGSAVTHMGYFSPIHRVYEFVGDNLYHFLVPGHNHTPEDCEKERKERTEHEERRLMLERPEST